MTGSDYSTNLKVKKLLAEIQDQINIFAGDQLSHIDRLREIGIALSAETSLDKIFDMILEEALSYTSADGATIYSVSKDKAFLDFRVVYNRTMNLRMGGTYGPITWPSIPLYQEDGTKQLRNMATYVAHTGTAQRVDDVYHQEIFDNSGTRKVDKANNYRSKSMIAFPLKDHEQEILGVVQLINAMNEDEEIISFTDEHMAMLNALASFAAISMTNKKLIEGLETLLDQFIRSIAGAIDRKSKYTGGHIERVARLTEAIANKIQEDSSGHYKDRHFTEDEMREISMSGWMHDLGKIITPAHIMDKSTKLETIFDRIELIKTRFELAEAVIEKDIAIKKANKEDTRELEKLIEQVRADFEFVDHINFGGEFMKDEDLVHVENIYKFQYDSGGKHYFLITENEKNNLCVRRGTLMPDEFSIMRDHAQVTSEMLKELTFPKKYRNVPLYASSHHEKLNGKGYPCQLEEANLPLQARIISIADLYEALTACDRPYKKGKTLSETLRIMGFMAKDREIDKDILDLFIDTKLYLDYAYEYLKDEQIDNIDADKIKSLYHTEGN